MLKCLIKAVSALISDTLALTGLIASSMALMPSLAMAATHNPYEVSLGIFKNDVIEILGDPAEKTIDRSCCSDEEWSYDQGKVLFCKGMVTAIQIDLSPNLRTFVRAVEEEKKARGEATFTFESRIGGSIKADWGVEPYRHLSISLYGNTVDSSLSVHRWLQDIRPCEK